MQSRLSYAAWLGDPMRRIPSRNFSKEPITIPSVCHESLGTADASNIHLRAAVHLRRQLRWRSVIIQGQLHKGQAEPEGRRKIDQPEPCALCQWGQPGSLGHRVLGENQLNKWQPQDSHSSRLKSWGVWCSLQEALNCVPEICPSLLTVAKNT